MNKDEAFREIQAICNSTPVIVLGSGASVPYGIASMNQLANELKRFFSSKSYANPEDVKAVRELIDVLDSGVGLEAALHQVKVSDDVEKDITETVWNVIYEADAKIFERFMGGEEMKLTPLYNHIIYDNPGKKLRVISTNYDRISEYAACQTDAFINIGFKCGSMGSIKDDVISHPLKPEKDYTGYIDILKVHGSLDWFRKEDAIYNIPNSVKIPTGFVPCIVTPGVNKYERTQHVPFRQLLSTVDKIFEDTQCYLCIGYGFNDVHVQEMLLKNSKKKKAKILILTKEITSSIQKNVIDKEYDYAAVYSNGAKGTTIKCPNGEYTAPDKEYWTIDGLMEIIK